MKTETIAHQTYSDRGIDISLRVTLDETGVVSFHVSRSDTESGKETCVSSGPIQRYSNLHDAGLHTEASLYRGAWWEIHKAQLHAMAISAAIQRQLINSQ